MAKLETLECSSCGAPIGLDQLDECPHCGSKNFIKSTIDPLVMDQKKINEYIGFFQKRTEDNPGDTNALFTMGLFYLRLQNYELAQRNMKQAVDLSPLEPDVYYYYAMSLIAGRSPKNLDHEVAKRVEEWLNTAINMQRKRKYLALMAFVEQGAFMANGLQCKLQPDDLIKEALTMVPDGGEMLEINANVRLDDSTNQRFFKMLQGENHEKKDDEGIYYKSYYLGGYVCPACGHRSLIWADKNDDGYACYCTNCENKLYRPPLARIDGWISLYPSYRDYNLSDEPENGALRLMNSEERCRFLDNLWEPDKPDKIQKPKFPVFNLIWRFVLMLVVTIIFFVVESAVCYSTKDIEREERQTVYQEYKRQYGKKGYGSAKRKELMAEIRSDSIARALADSAFFADYWTYAYIDYSEDGKPKTHFGAINDEIPRPYRVYGLRKNWHTILTILFFLLPFLVWLIKTIVAIGRVIRTRRNVTLINKANMDEYEEGLLYFNSRPTIQDYLYFCTSFMGKNGFGGKGDLVADALKKSGVDERDVAGKILFLNYFDWQDDNDDNTVNPEEVFDRIYYVIAIPEKDQLTIYENYWSTCSDYVSDCDSESVFYRNITSIKKEDDSIIIRMVGGEEKIIMLPPYRRENILSYQAEKPRDSSSFSITRTGDASEFVKALNKLISCYQK